MPPDRPLLICAGITDSKYRPQAKQAQPLKLSRYTLSSSGSGTQEGRPKASCPLSILYRFFFMDHPYRKPASFLRWRACTLTNYATVLTSCGTTLVRTSRGQCPIISHAIYLTSGTAITDNSAPTFFDNCHHYNDIFHNLVPSAKGFRISN